MNRRIVFKCSFGGADGWGHVVRCSALANAFQSRGWETVLWTDGEFTSLPSDVASSFTGASEEGEIKAPVLFVDEMYTEQSAFDGYVAAWKLRNPGSVIAGVDDMQRRSMAGFDLVVNSEIGLVEASYASSSALLGERFALLRSGFQKPAVLENYGDFDGLVPILVMIGGTDAFGYLPRVLQSLAQIDGQRFAPVVVGDISSESLRPFAASRVLQRIGASEMAAWMAFCRLGIIGCGSSLYEAAAMELPFVGLSIVDNQVATARKVEAHWGMPILHLETGGTRELELSSSLLTLLEQKKVAYSKVDTLGASRVCDALEVLCG